MAIPGDPHVVIVEDNQDSLIIMLKLLARSGIVDCRWYPSGRAVVAFVKAMSQGRTRRPPDLILLDIGLPHEDGYAVLQDLRADAVLHHTPVVAVTASASPEEMKRAREAGFDGFIGKPIDPVRFPGQIQRILAGESLWEL